MTSDRQDWTVPASISLTALIGALDGIRREVWAIFGEDACCDVALQADADPGSGHIRVRAYRLTESLGHVLIPVAALAEASDPWGAVCQTLHRVFALQRDADHPGGTDT